MFLLRLLLRPVSAFALQDRSLAVGTGVNIAWMTVLGNVIGFMTGSAIGVCSLIFLLGAAQITVSHGDQTKVDNGKKMMQSALIGLAIILSAYAIIRTTLYFLYEGAP